MKSGQTLAMLLVFMSIAITVTTAAVFVSISNTQSSSKFADGFSAYDIAESGIENALLRLLRNPSYTGETLTVGDGTATIIVSGTGPYTIVSSGQVGNFRRQITAVTNDTGGALTITSWIETFP
jgi:hypothetical protein